MLRLLFRLTLKLQCTWFSIDFTSVKDLINFVVGVIFPTQMLQVTQVEWRSVNTLWSWMMVKVCLSSFINIPFLCLNIHVFPIGNLDIRTKSTIPECKTRIGIIDRNLVYSNEISISNEDRKYYLFLLCNRYNYWILTELSVCQCQQKEVNTACYCCKSYSNQPYYGASWLCCSAFVLQLLLVIQIYLLMWLGSQVNTWNVCLPMRLRSV